MDDRPTGVIRLALLLLLEGLALTLLLMTVIWFLLG
jgi:hypothetical protein